MLIRYFTWYNMECSKSLQMEHLSVVSQIKYLPTVLTTHALYFSNVDKNFAAFVPPVALSGALDIFHLAGSSFAEGTIDEPLPEQTHSSATTEKALEKILLMFPSVRPSIWRLWHFPLALLSFSYLINFPPNYMSISHQCNTTTDAHTHTLSVSHCELTTKGENQ